MEGRNILKTYKILGVWQAQKVVHLTSLLPAPGPPALLLIRQLTLIPEPLPETGFLWMVT